MQLQHHHAILTIKPQHMSEARKFLVECEDIVAKKLNEGGPVHWCCTEDQEHGRFHVYALFTDDAAVEFHQENIKNLVQNVGPLLAAPPETIISEVFAQVPS